MIIDHSLSIQHCQAQFFKPTEVIKGSRKLLIFINKQDYCTYFLSHQ